MLKFFLLIALVWGIFCVLIAVGNVLIYWSYKHIKSVRDYIDSLYADFHFDDYEVNEYEE